MQWGICAHYGVYAPEPGQGVGGLDDGDLDRS